MYTKRTPLSQDAELNRLNEILDKLKLDLYDEVIRNEELRGDIQ